MDSFDKYLEKQYNPRDYTCFHFASEVWHDITNIDISNELLEMFALHHLTKKFIRRFELLDKPISPCLVVMQRGRTVPHIGIHYEGNILHIHGRGVEYHSIPTATRGFQYVRYFVCKN